MVSPRLRAVRQLCKRLAPPDFAVTLLRAKLLWLGVSVSDLKARGDSKPNENSLYTLTQSPTGETGLFAVLWLVGLVAVVVAFLAATVPAGYQGQLAGGLPPAPVLSGLSSKHLASDAAKSNGCVQYFFELQPTLATNLSVAGCLCTNSLGLTNRSML